MQVSAERIWAAAQHDLRAMLSGDIFNLWFAPLRPCGQENGGLVLEVANDFCEVWLKDNYLDLIQEVVCKASGRPMQVKFKVVVGRASLAPTAAEPVAAKPKLLEPITERSSGIQEFGFNPKNTFDTFVVGNNN